MQQDSQWVIANIYSGEIAPHTARYGSMDEAGGRLRGTARPRRGPDGSAVGTRRLLTARASTRPKRRDHLPELQGEAVCPSSSRPHDDETVRLGRTSRYRGGSPSPPAMSGVRLSANLNLAGAYDSRTRGSITTRRMSATMFSTAMQRAVNRVVPMTSGTSRFCTPV